jgi:hypothetical protein
MSEDLLHTIADVAAIVTAISVAISAWGYLRHRLIVRRRRLRIEKILEEKKLPNDDSLTLRQIAVELTVTQPDVIEAASRSKKVEGWAGHVDQQYRLRYRRLG